MRVAALSLMFFLAALAPVQAIDILKAGQNSLQGVIKWVPAKIQEGGEDLALVIGAGRSEQAIRFWSGGKVDGAELEKLVGRQVAIDGVVHEYVGVWFIRPDKLSLARGSATAAKAPAAPISSPPERASSIASQWFLDQHRGRKLEPVVRVKKLDGNIADVFVVGQGEDGQFSNGVKLTVDVEGGTVSRQE